MSPVRPRSHRYGRSARAIRAVRSLSIALSALLSVTLLIGSASLASFTYSTRVEAGELTGAAYLVTVEGELADVMVDLDNAVTGQGLVVDYTGHIGDMLTRTADAVGASSPYVDAQYLLFCSSKHTHAAVAANPANLSICPYIVFAYTTTDNPGEVVIGYRRPFGADDAASRAAVAEVEALLQRIVDDAGEGW